MGVLALTLLFLLWQGSYRGHVTNFGERTAPMARQAAQEMADRLPPWRESGLNPVVVLPFVGPKGHRLADKVREAIDARGVYDVIGQGKMEASLRSLDLDFPKLASEEEARGYAANIGAQAVVLGRIIDLDETSDPPVLSFRVIFAATEGEFRWEAEFTASAEEAIARLPGSGSNGGVATRFLSVLGKTMAFLAFCLATPLLLFPLTRSFLARGNNVANGCMLLFYAVANTLLLALTWGGGMWAMVVSFLTALWLNYIVCDRLDRRSDA